MYQGVRHGWSYWGHCFRPDRCPSRDRGSPRRAASGNPRRSQRDRQQRTDGVRAERKEAILGFLAAAQRVELILDRRELGLSAPEDPQDEKLHDLWLAKKAIELAYTHDTGQAAHDYTKALHAPMRNTVAPELAPTERDSRYAHASGTRRLGERPPEDPAMMPNRLVSLSCLPCDRDLGGTADRVL